MRTSLIIYVLMCKSKSIIIIFTKTWSQIINNMRKLLKFPDVPKKYLYEDYIAAHIQASGIFIERSLINSDVDEILELDIVASDICEDKVDKILIEIKSGGWGYPDLFKVKGWMMFLNIDKGAFIVQKNQKNQKTCCDIANDLNIIL